MFPLCILDTMKLSKSLLIVVIFFANIIYWGCSGIIEEQQHEKYLNLHDSVEYVGKDKCIQCHSAVHETFQHTGMGQSFGKATKSKSSANFHSNSNVVNDSILNLSYQADWKGSDLIFTEFRLSGKDTIHKRQERIDYIIGSGQHTNSHLFTVNNFLFQAPITFYTQKGIWDLAPGFENGFNSRFSRYIGKECMTCHNGLPEMSDEANNLYDQIPLGIDCERCHGPGEIHVKDKINELIVDTSKGPDYSIVNPKRLSIDYQNSLCQRCHLQGIAVLQEGKDYDDFKPGMLLKDIMDVYLPQFSNGDDKMLMASHVERLKKSKCFNSKKLSCITCHNPHLSVEETSSSIFNQQCKSCHANYKEAHKGEELIEDDCITCHMPKTGSIDIPHVAFTDHFIGIHKEEAKTSNKEVNEFEGLVCINNKQADDISKIKAYLAYYQKYDQNTYSIDSAQSLLNKTKDPALEIELAYVLKKYKEVISISKKYNETELNHKNAYRVGESYYQLAKYHLAITHLKKALQLKPKHTEYAIKLGAAYVNTSNLEEAAAIFRYVISLNPKEAVAFCNLGYIQMLKANYSSAEENLRRSISLDPDYRLAWENLINLFYQTNRKVQAINVINDFLLHHPKDEKMEYVKAQING